MTPPPPDFATPPSHSFTQNFLKRHFRSILQQVDFSSLWSKISSLWPRPPRGTLQATPHQPNGRRISIKPVDYFPSEHHSVNPPSDDDDSVQPRSSMSSTKLFKEPAIPFPPAKSPVDANPPLHLTAEIYDMANRAKECYDDIRFHHVPQEAEISSNFVQGSPFSSMSHGEVEVCYAAISDARNAVGLRKLVTAADIRDALESLLPRLCQYLQDRAVLSTLSSDERLIREECSRRDEAVDFRGLDYARAYVRPDLGQSVRERFDFLFNSTEWALADDDSAAAAVDHFLADPASFSELRSPFFPTARR